MRAMVLGRFQPFHIGHLKMVEYVASKCDHLIIGVGSCNKQDTSDNPFTAREREEMIIKSIHLEVPYSFHEIPDFGDNGEWISWIAKNICFDVFYTNSANEKEIFEKAGFRVEEIPFFNRKLYSATEVRKRMASKKDHVKLLPQGTLEVLDKIDGVDRILSCVD
ncbi:MAG: nicotinamide-nucleotide adenylyltransferase [Candidatus Altiarchaeota archaeon]|nr:nicotinamide-nucleotide adenylyltransferase [Candidatus Altiarchaeota archaeon]